MRVKCGSVLLFFAVMVLVSCNSLSYQRAQRPGFGFEVVNKNKKGNASEEAFARAIVVGTPEEIEEFLKAGHDPNKMSFLGAIPWHDTNPLWRLHHYYDKSALFIKYGADVTKRPYISAIFTNKIISERFPDESLLIYAGTKYEKEVYDLVKLFLDAGADPNFKGTGSPQVLIPPSDERYNEYFKKYGELPINIAIEFSAFTIVDLLLEYGSVLDGESLLYAQEATERIGNTVMEDYIKELLEKQENGEPLFSR
jgi:ankyrin repeat protein